MNAGFRKKLHFSSTKRLSYTFLALVASCMLCGVFLFALGYNPLVVYGIIAEGALGSSYGFMKTLAKSTPLIFTGLSVFFADKGGLFNIGAEGQLLVGGLSAGIFGYHFASLQIFPPIGIVLTLFLSFCIGAVWGLIPGYLKAYRSSNEFIVSMMMNYVAMFLCEYLVTYPFRGPGVLAKTPEIPSAYLLPRIASGSQFNLGFFIGVVVVIGVFWFFKNTSTGYEIKTLGANANAAVAAGVDVRKRTIYVFCVAGGLAALAGAIEVLGVHGFYINDLSPGYGYDGIAVSVLSQGNPFGVLLSALLFGALRAGGARLDLRSKVPSEFVIILQAVVIVFIATPQLFRMRRRKDSYV